MSPYEDSIQQYLASGGGFVAFVVYVLYVIALWRVFSKAGYAGILAIIPIVNAFVLVKIAGYSGWLTLLYIIPIVAFVFHFFVSLRVGERFGKGTLFSIVLLWIFSIIGFFILGYGDAKYTKKA